MCINVTKYVTNEKENKNEGYVSYGSVDVPLKHLSYEMRAAF